MPAAIAACTVATHSSNVVSPHTMPMPPPPSVSAETGQSLPKLFCRMNAASGIRITIRSRPNAGNYLRQVRSLLLLLQRGTEGSNPSPSRDEFAANQTFGTTSFFSTDVYEQAPELTEVGGGINMAPNPTRILRRARVHAPRPGGSALLRRRQSRLAGHHRAHDVCRRCRSDCSARRGSGSSVC